mgnify:CR=1 FL=1
MKSGFKMKGYSYPGKSPVKQKVDPDAPGTPGKPGFEPPVTSMDYLTKTPAAPDETTKDKTEKPGPGYSWVHKYWKKGTSNTVPHSGTGPGAGNLMPGYPRWEKIK